MASLSVIIKAFQELGPRQLGLFAGYKLGLRIGYFGWATSKPANMPPGSLNVDWLELPERQDLIDLLGENGVAHTLAEANEIVAGDVRLFGSSPVPLQLTLSSSLHHWSVYERGEQAYSKTEGLDPKFIWEPGRFGWAYTLGRAFHLSADELYAQAFWQYAETFLDSNPAYLGPHWISAQEVALRLIALVFALRVFDESLETTAERKTRLARAIADHAQRIPPTLIYARAQNNNHLLTEAAGLYTASLSLPEHPSASQWRQLGWRWFNRGILAQVGPDGAYIQQSTNYHRLMLQIALWMAKLTGADGHSLPEDVQARLGAATCWLHALLDPQSGYVPNLGPNDGAHIFPLTVHPYADYRPILQAASLAFLGRPAIASNFWDEMACWLVGERVLHQGRATYTDNHPCAETENPSSVIRLDKHPSWAYLRTAHISGRPGHSDQLHLDLWWLGMNLAQDPGTYLYNAAHPWDNALTRTQVHNTLTVNGQEQMLRVGRFLYLQRAQGYVLENKHDVDGGWQRVVAQHNGYSRVGVIHQRSVTGYESGRWVIEDRLLPSREQTPRMDDFFQTRLQWLLPDWDWEIDDENRSEIKMFLISSYGRIQLTLSSVALGQLMLARAGELVYGSGEIEPTWGWRSPTYGDKIPTLSLRWSISGNLPLVIQSEWILP